MTSEIKHPHKSKYWGNSKGECNVHVETANGNKIKLANTLTVDEFTRCIHYHSELDVIAIKFKCCGIFYPCHKCHSEETKENHAPERWSKDDLMSEKVVLCGFCHSTLTFSQYANNESFCIYCSTPFNPNCSYHYELYFDLS